MCRGLSLVIRIVFIRSQKDLVVYRLTALYGTQFPFRHRKPLTSETRNENPICRPLGRRQVIRKTSLLSGFGRKTEFIRHKHPNSFVQKSGRDNQCFTPTLVKKQHRILYCCLTRVIGILFLMEKKKKNLFFTETLTGTRTHICRSNPQRKV